MNLLGLMAAPTGLKRLAICAVAAAFMAGAALAQTTTSFGGRGFAHDSAQPIQVSADSLEVRNADSAAIFRGSVRVRQGQVRMTATELQVTYARGGSDGAIDRLRAIGDVIITNGAETATSNAADYSVEAGEIIMTGDVLLVQGPNAILGDRLRIDLESGVATMSGRVTVKLQPESGQ